MQNAGLDEKQAGIKIARKKINNLRYVDDTTLMAENERELKNLLMKVKEESEKAGLKLNIQKTKIMASVLSLHGRQMGKMWKSVRFHFLGLQNQWGQVTAAMKLKDAAYWKDSYDKSAAAAKSLQSCPTLCDPIDGSPPGSAIPGILQARTLEWVAISFTSA